MVEWDHLLDGHDFEQALGVGDGQGSLVCCSPWGLKESDTTEQLNRTELIHPGLISFITRILHLLTCFNNFTHPTTTLMGQPPMCSLFL